MEPEAKSSLVLCAAVLRFRHADDAAGHTRAGVARRLCLQVIGVFMHDDGVADDGIGAVQRNHFVHALVMCFAGCARIEITKVAGVTNCGVGPAVLCVMGIEVPARRGRIGGAAIAEFVDVKTMLARPQADHIRDELAKMGVVLKDTKDGTTWEIAR